MASLLPVAIVAYEAPPPTVSSSPTGPCLVFTCEFSIAEVTEQS
jgi:hypothetical protein